MKEEARKKIIRWLVIAVCILAILNALIDCARWLSWL